MGTFQVDEMNLAMLLSEGVERSLAMDSLRRANNNLDRARQLVKTATPSPPNYPVAPAVLQQHLQAGLQAALKPGTSSSPINLNDPDDDLQKALQLSMMDSGKAGAAGIDKMDVDGVPQLSQDEIEMNKAIEKSLAETKGDGISLGAVSDNPQWRKREDGVATGLKNIGNTCYFNSMLQTYFMIPEIRKAVLQFPANLSLPETDPNKPTVEFMKQLQRLFAFLIYSNQKYIDPSALLKNLMGKDGKPVSIGDQQDVADFNELILTTIAKGLDLVVPADKAGLIKNLFYGSGPEYLQYEQNGGIVESFQDTELSSLILPISEEPSDLFERIDASVCQEVADYKTDKGTSAKAQRCLWLKNAPKMLMLQQSRVQYDLEKKNYVKRESPVRFEKEIYIDRYLIQNKDETTKRRAIVAGWKEELFRLEKELRSYTNYKDRPHGLDEALTSVIDYCKEKFSSSSDELFAKMVTKLSECLTTESAAISALRSKVDEFKTKISTAYSDMNQKPYSLFAVWIHQGYAGSGHYWAYVRNPNTEKWTKFNDMRVCEMDEETVMKEATGGTANTSAYFLIYMDAELVKTSGFDQLGANWDSFVSEALQKEVQEDNQKFLKELEEYLKKNTDKFQQFCDKYSETLAQTEKQSNQSQLVDTRTKSYFAFLDSVGVHDVMIAEIARETYSTIFGRGIEQDVSTGMYSKVEERIGKEIVVKATELAFDENLTKPLKEQHQKFQKISQLYESGLTALVERKYFDALRALVTAHQQDKELESLSVRRGDEIMRAIGTCFLAMLEDAGKKLKSGEVSACVSTLRQLVTTSCNVLDKQSPLFNRLKELYSQFVAEASVSASVQDTFKDLKAMLDGVRQPAMPFIAPTLEKLDAAKYEQLAQKHADSLAKFREDFAPILQQFRAELGGGDNKDGTDAMDMEMPPLETVK